jgi:carotenoid cleavage dioxygenase-like enzyme
MMHDFALTEKYVVFFDLPVTFSLDAVSAGRELPYTWNPAHQARVGLLPRDGSAEVRWLAINPRWVFHTLNAYDDGPRVDDRAASRPHRYGYNAMIGGVGQAISPLTGDFADEAFTNALLKHDLAHGTAEVHDFGRDATAGEAVFAPASPDAAEPSRSRSDCRSGSVSVCLVLASAPGPSAQAGGIPGLSRARRGIWHPAGRPICAKRRSVGTRSG